MNREEIGEWLATLVRGLVSNPDDVKVEVSMDEMGVLYTLSLNNDDAGKVIGKKGATANAVRTLLRVVGANSDIRASVKIDVPDIPGRPRHSEATPEGNAFGRVDS